MQQYNHFYYKIVIMDRTKFREDQIPYEILEEFGLSRNMVSDLPMDILSQVLAGQRSPVLPIEKKISDNEKVHSKARFSLIFTDEGQVDVVFHPVVPPIGDTMWIVTRDEETGKEALKEVDIRSMYSETVIEELKTGKAVLDYMVAKDGRKQKAFLQLDPETNEILSVPSPVIGRNLQALMGRLNLTTAESHCLQNGEILTLMPDNDRMVTIGIDLNEPTGFRIEEGDEKRWKERSKREWAKYNIGVFGCWIMDEDGGLSYVKEEDYTDEVWEEVERRSNSRKAGPQSSRVI